MALSPQGLVRGLVARYLPTRKADSQDTDVAFRLKSYGDVGVESVWNTRHVLADEGCVFTATMLPGATTLQLGLSATFSALAGAIVIGNSASKTDPNAKSVYLDYLRMLVITAPTSGTNLLYATVLDDTDRTPTTISNGGSDGPGTPATATAYLSKVNCTNMGLTPAPVSRVYFPMSTAAGAPPVIPKAGPNARTIVGNGPLRAQIPVAGDEYLVQFGNIDAQQALVTAAPAGASRVVSHHPAVVLGPGQWFVFYLWSLSNATAGLAFSGLEAGLIER